MRRWAVALAIICALLAGQAQAQDGGPTVIIYARADQAQAQRAARLAAVWGRVWMDDALRPGTAWRAEVAQRLLGARTVLLMWSRRAAESAEVGAEWRIALACSGCQVLPILLDDAPLPGELAGRQAVDWR